MPADFQTDAPDSVCRRCGSPRVSSEKLTDGSVVYSCADCSGVTFEEPPQSHEGAINIRLRADERTKWAERGVRAEAARLDDRELPSDEVNDG